MARNSAAVLASSVMTCSPAARHHLERRGVLRGRFGAHARLERLRRGRDLDLILRGDLVPRGVGHDQRAGQRRDVESSMYFASL